MTKEYYFFQKGLKTSKNKVKQVYKEREIDFQIVL